MLTQLLPPINQFPAEQQTDYTLLVDYIKNFESTLEIQWLKYAIALILKILQMPQDAPILDLAPDYFQYGKQDIYNLTFPLTTKPALFPYIKKLGSFAKKDLRKFLPELLNVLVKMVKETKLQKSLELILQVNKKNVEEKYSLPHPIRIAHRLLSEKSSLDSLRPFFSFNQMENPICLLIPPGKITQKDIEKFGITENHDTLELLSKLHQHNISEKNIHSLTFLGESRSQKSVSVDSATMHFFINQAVFIAEQLSERLANEEYTWSWLAQLDARFFSAEGIILINQLDSHELHHLNPSILNKLCKRHHGDFQIISEKLYSLIRLEIIDQVKKSLIAAVDLSDSRKLNAVNLLQARCRFTQRSFISAIENESPYVKASLNEKILVDHSVYHRRETLDIPRNDLENLKLSPSGEIFEYQEYMSHYHSKKHADNLPHPEELIPISEANTDFELLNQLLNLQHFSHPERMCNLSIAWFYTGLPLLSRLEPFFLTDAGIDFLNTLDVSSLTHEDIDSLNRIYLEFLLAYYVKDVGKEIDFEQIQQEFYREKRFDNELHRLKHRLIALANRLINEDINEDNFIARSKQSMRLKELAESHALLTKIPLSWQTENYLLKLSQLHENFLRSEAGIDYLIQQHFNFSDEQIKRFNEALTQHNGDIKIFLSSQTASLFSQLKSLSISSVTNLLNGVSSLFKSSKEPLETQETFTSEEDVQTQKSMGVDH